MADDITTLYLAAKAAYRADPTDPEAAARFNAAEAVLADSRDGSTDTAGAVTPDPIAVTSGM